LQANEVVIPPSVYVTVLSALTVSLASPTCSVDDDCVARRKELAGHTVHHQQVQVVCACAGGGLNQMDPRPAGGVDRAAGGSPEFKVVVAIIMMIS
jgi:hypothetical protein